MLLLYVGSGVPSRGPFSIKILLPCYVRISCGMLSGVPYKRIFSVPYGRVFGVPYKRASGVHRIRLILSLLISLSLLLAAG